MSNEIGNPTIPSITERTMSTEINKWAEKHSKILEAFLTEYMEVNGIEENELKNHVSLAQTDEGMFISEGNVTILEMKWSKIVCSSENYEVKASVTLTTNLPDKEKYPKTYQLLQELT